MGRSTACHRKPPAPAPVSALPVMFNVDFWDTSTVDKIVATKANVKTAEQGNALLIGSYVYSLLTRLLNHRLNDDWRWMRKEKHSLVTLKNNPPIPLLWLRTTWSGYVLMMMMLRPMVHEEDKSTSHVTLPTMLFRATSLVMVMAMLVTEMVLDENSMEEDADTLIKLVGLN